MDKEIQMKSNWSRPLVGTAICLKLDDDTIGKNFPLCAWSFAVSLSSVFWDYRTDVVELVFPDNEEFFGKSISKREPRSFWIFGFCSNTRKMTCLYEQFWACRSRDSSVSNCSVFLITRSAVFSRGNEMHHFRLSSSKICRASCLIKLFFLVSRHTFVKMKKTKTIIRTRPAWTMPAVGGCGHYRYTALTLSILLWFYAFSHLSTE